MTDPRLPTDIIIAARLRALQAQGISCYVVKKGAAESGSILLRSVLRQGASVLYVQSLDDTGKPGWMRVFEDGPVTDEKAADYVARSLKRDPDLWVIEIEDKTGKNLFE